MQLKNEMKDGETYLAILDEVQEVSGIENEELYMLLEDYKNVFLDDLPPGLLPSRSVDHKIEIILESISPSKLTY